MRFVALLTYLLFAAAASSAAVRPDSMRVTVSYLAGGAVYISAGRDAGVADSSLCYIVERRDTIAVLKVIAMSSTSSVCSVVRAKRPLVIGDVVKVSVVSQKAAPLPPVLLSQDSTTRVLEASPIRMTPPEKPTIVLHGRLNVQYSTTRQSAGGPTLRRPGLVLSLRGAARDIPLTLELYGNFRSLSNGGALFGKGTVNQNRIYTLSLQYDDGSYRVAAGRISQAISGTAGYLDGMSFSRRFDNLTLGFSGGFEPLFSQRSFGSDVRKFSLFGNYSSEGSVPASATLAYTRSFFHSALERDVATASATVAPSGDWLFMTQGDVDLHTKRGGALISQPTLTNLYSSMRYRISQSVSAGVGVSAWRPTYAFSSVSSIPDSMLDHSLRTSPTANLSLLLPSAISIYNAYSTRSSEGGFGREYSNYTSLNAANLFGEGLSARGSASFNATAFARIRGIGGSLQKSFLGVADATLRYQWYRYAYASWGGVSTSNTAGIDLMMSAFPGVSLWGSLERMMSSDVSATSVFIDIGWRF